ncbi:hypothetical protein STCU_05388 [Strigomonas culicis]|uniref:Uncharacterized protein n=1 Tax=Strigomonas culicis TaxID=28005 RepID=S9UGR3_9TRYP|nr:hypothetical protein STCU_05388 [Strigomonas culicis]|eukprot:EPY27949.1 hypothetical protein STCU_05388 [Strigomonas culicis]
MVLAAAFVLLYLLWPFMLVDVVVRMFMINLWGRVLLYYFYGFTSLRAYLAVVKQVGLVLLSGDHHTALMRLLEGYLDLNVDHLGFFNFMVLMAVFSSIIFILIVVIRVRLMFFP